MYTYVSTYFAFALCLCKTHIYISVNISHRDNNHLQSFLEQKLVFQSIYITMDLGPYCILSTLYLQLRRGYFRSITYTMEIAPYCGVCNVKLSFRRGYFHSSNRKENTHSVDQLTH